jgi:hypothetical protein
MKNIFAGLFLFLIFAMECFAQMGINADNSAPNNSAMLDVKSSVRGFLPPRMTRAEINSISGPADGLVVYCTDCGSNGLGALSMFMAGAWYTLSANCLNPVSPIAGTHVPSPTQIVWNWNTVSGATGYKWNTTNDCVTATDMGTATTKTENGLTCNTAYTRYAWAYCAGGNSNPVTLTQSTLPNLPATPIAGTHVPGQTQIVWNWNTVSGATGYKWNTLNNYITATDMGLTTTKTETGLTCNTAYTRYVWAYNLCTYSAPVSLTQTTLICGFICGYSTITINHVAGAVAPVTKTVTYGTVTSIPGETSKCWITSNLGADHQATAVDDATEASAGWYWQFNRKRGYKNDGSIVTPSWTITGISENFDWITANDPCAIELGVGWRIPAYTEWFNADASGTWTNWDGPWNSGLKLHAAGSLLPSDGFLTLRGTVGYYWSSKQAGITDQGWGLAFGSANSVVSNYNKAQGNTLRCIKE